MTATLKVQPKGQVTIPLTMWNEAGLATGALLKATARRGSIVLTSKAVAPNDEHSRAQRRFINRRLAKGLQDIRRGRLRGPFDTVEDLVVSMEDDVKRIRAARKTKRRR